MPRFDMNRAITKAILENVGTDFLLKDGSIAMTDDFDMGSSTGNLHHLENCCNITPFDHNVGSIGNLSPAKYFQQACISVINFIVSMTGMASTSTIKTADDITYHLLLKSYDTARRTCIDLVAGYADIPRAGDITFLPGKSLDLLTNGAYLKLRRLSQSALPTPETGELLLFNDTDDNTTHLVYEDSVQGTRSVELASHEAHSGVTGTRSFVDGEGKNHDIVIEDGLIKSWIKEA